MFEVKLFEFEHVASGRRLVRAQGLVTVPEELSGLVVLVEGLTNFPVTRPHKRTSIDLCTTPFNLVICLALVFSHTLLSEALVAARE